MTSRYLCVLAMSLVSIQMRAQMRTFSDNFAPGEASQMPRYGNSLHGQVIAQGTDVARSFVVQLSDCDKLGPGRIGVIDSDGGFSFEGVESGCHTLSVLTMVHREAVYNNTVTVDRAMPDVTIDLQTKAPQRPASGFVSMRQLMNPPPRKAHAAWEKGARATQKEHFEEALTHYRRAIELSPNYADAHEGMALALEGLARPAEASKEWETARRLGIESPELYSGLSLCLYQLNRKDEADQAARQALTKDPSFAPAHFLLACSLMSRGKCPGEALNHFSRAAGRIPKALFLSARLRFAGGDLEGARRELGEYLKLCPASERPPAESLLSDVRGRMALAQSLH